MFLNEQLDLIVTCMCTNPKQTDMTSWQPYDRTYFVPLACCTTRSMTNQISELYSHSLVIVTYSSMVFTLYALLEKKSNDNLTKSY